MPTCVEFGDVMGWGRIFIAMEKDKMTNYSQPANRAVLCEMASKMLMCVAVAMVTTACGGVGGRQVDATAQLAQAQGEAALQLERGDRFLESGQYHYAYNAYTVALKLSPEHLGALHSRAIASMKRRKFEAALTDFDLLLELGGEDPTVYFNLGNIYVRTTRLQQAIKVYKRSLELKPDQFDVMNNLSNCYADLGRLDEAKALLEKITRMWPDRPEPFSNLGTIYEVEKDYKMAESHYLKAISVEPNHPAAHYNLGSLMVKNRRVREALTHYREFIKLSPDAFDARKVQSRVNVLSGAGPS